MLAPLGCWCSNALSCISPACAECMDLLGLCALIHQLVALLWQVRVQQINLLFGLNGFGCPKMYLDYHESNTYKAE